MAFKGEVEISAPQSGTLKNEKFSVLECDYKFYTPADNYGRITGRRVVGRINFVIETTPTTVHLATLFFTHGVIEGKFTFFNRDEISKMMEVKFENARIIELETAFESEGVKPMVNTLVISTEKIEIISGGNVAMDTNDWDAASEY